jgi:hypothetical protein
LGSRSGQERNLFNCASAQHVKSLASKGNGSKNNKVRIPEPVKGSCKGSEQKTDYYQLHLTNKCSRIKSGISQKHRVLP